MSDEDTYKSSTVDHGSEALDTIVLERWIRKIP